jgi:hypothetical protein
VESIILWLKNGVEKVIFGLGRRNLSRKMGAKSRVLWLKNEVDFSEKGWKKVCY